jgi:hypothetical protein
MGSPGRSALAGLVVVLASGCGTATNGSNPTAMGRTAGNADYAQVAEGSCATGEANGKPFKTRCVFVLADGRRFSCPQRFAQAVQTASSL